jgi:hypothetical protein
VRGPSRTALDHASGNEALGDGGDVAAEALRDPALRYTEHES